MVVLDACQDTNATLSNSNDLTDQGPNKFCLIFNSEQHLSPLSSFLSELSTRDCSLFYKKQNKMTVKDALAPTPYLQNFHTSKTTHNAALSQPPAYTHTHTQGHLRTSPFKTNPLPLSTALNYTLSFPTKQTRRCRYSALVVTPANKERGKATCHRKHAPP